MSGSQPDSPSFEIRPLGVHPAPLAELAGLLRTEWPAWYGPGGEGNADDDVRACLATTTLPACLCACLPQGDVVGLVMLRTGSIASHRHLTPWVTTLLVVPAWRGRGLGTALIGAAEDEARRLGLAHLHLASGRMAALLTRRGWQHLEQVEHDGAALDIWRLSLR